MQKFIQELSLEFVLESIKVINRNREQGILDNTENEAIELACMYQNARKVKKNTIHAKQEEILSWYYYAEGFKKRINDNLSFCRNNKKADDLARIQVYDEIWNCLSGVSHKNFASKLKELVRFIIYLTV